MTNALLANGDTRIECFSKALAAVVKGQHRGIFARDVALGMLLAFLWKKAHTIADSREYMDALARQLGIESHELYTWPRDMENRPFTRAYYQAIKDQVIASPACMCSWPLDELVFVCGSRVMYDDNMLPDNVGMMSDAPYKDKGFPDCGETSLLNFINALCYNQETKRFEQEILRALGFTAPVLAFYEKYPTTEFMGTPQAHGDWAAVVSELPDVAYSESRGGTKCVCNIKPGFDNLMKVLCHLCFGLHSLDELAQRLRAPGLDMDLEIVPATSS